MQTVTLETKLQNMTRELVDVLTEPMSAEDVGVLRDVVDRWQVAVENATCNRCWNKPGGPPAECGRRHP